MLMAPDSIEAATSCGCKGVRSCLICEKLKNKLDPDPNEPKLLRRFRYHPETTRAVSVDGDSASFPFPGVFMWEEFISEQEEKELIGWMDQEVWNPSQSGRRKQDFGPKVNFKKQKVRLGSFNGLPASSHNLVLRMQRAPALSGFDPVEQCNLDYDPQRGSAIDPHLDDSWLWGERLVTVNMLSDTTLTLSLEGAATGPGGEVLVAVRLPRRSLVALFGDARHRWKHAIYRQDVTERRVCSTFRELSAEFLPGGEREELGARLMEVAGTYRGTPI